MILLGIGSLSLLGVGPRFCVEFEPSREGGASVRTSEAVGLLSRGVELHDELHGLAISDPARLAAACSDTRGKGVRREKGSGII